MKKLFLLIVASLFVTGAFAQNWAVGARVGSGLQAVGQYGYNANNYVEARLGACWLDTKHGGITADATVLHNWKIYTMDWTPSAGEWFFDAGVGLSGGGDRYHGYVGIAGMARLGFTFYEVPLSISVDYTPVIGPNFSKVHTDLHNMGFANLGITCTYNF
ncbi:MAG: hypothetical protein IKY89_01020 [Alistipes sp.]|nr:hypothetical protein [Alistipes sp.]